MYVHVATDRDVTVHYMNLNITFSKPEKLRTSININIVRSTHAILTVKCHQFSFEIMTWKKGNMQKASHLIWHEKFDIE